MGVIFTYLKPKKKMARMIAVGKTLQLLMLLVNMSKYLVERISQEKDMNMEKAEVFVLNCIRDGMKTIDD